MEASGKALKLQLQLSMCQVPFQRVSGKSSCLAARSTLIRINDCAEPPGNRLTLIHVNARCCPAATVTPSKGERTRRDGNQS